MRKYRQLTFRDRIYIELWKWESRSLKYMAECLGVSRSTISRELSRGMNHATHNGYRADLGERSRRLKSMKKGRKCLIVGTTADLVIEKLKEGWSPEQISGRLKLEGKVRVSYETIYRFIKADRDNGGKLYLLLRRGKRRYKRRFYQPRVRTDLLHRKHIDQRPQIINNRKRIGDWERDLMFGDSRSAALITFVERKTLYSILKKTNSKSPREIAEKTIEAMSAVDCKSITNDNGFEFREHQYESERLKVPIYFTNPYSSWEKGTCENINGLIRQYFPKKSSMKGLTDEDTEKIQSRLNSRPRKKLGFRTPMEAFFEGKFALNI